MRDPEQDGFNESVMGQSLSSANVGSMGGRTVYSKSQIDRMEDVIAANKGKLQGALKFGQLISKYHADIVTDYNGFSDAETIKESIEKYLKV